MISIKEISQRDIELCFELDSNTISLWSKKQWENELRKEGIKVFGISQSNLFVGICVAQLVLDEAQIHYFAINKNFQRRRLGTYFMKYLIKHFERLKINKILLEVSECNLAGERFYDHLGFSTMGIRKNYYKDGAAALLKEKKLFTDLYCADNQNS